LKVKWDSDTKLFVKSDPGPKLTVRIHNTRSKISIDRNFGRKKFLAAEFLKDLPKETVKGPYFIGVYF
jgi:hypothetical protein